METGFQQFKQRYSEKLKARYSRWLNRRLPEAKEITLTQRRIFILPTRLGLLFGGVLILLLMMAINYQNSMIFAYTFLLSSLFPVMIIFTFRNLSGLVIRVSGCSSVFAGESARVSLTLSRTDTRDRQQLVFKWKNSNEAIGNVIDDADHPIELYVPTDRRGPLKAERLYLHSIYPVGFIRAWSWLRLDLAGVVYPKPIEGDLPIRSTHNADGDITKKQLTAEEISGLRSYVPGDSPRKIAWKSYAATGELNVKEFEGDQSDQLWLDFDEVTGGHIEYKLSVLCYWVLKLESEQAVYGLRLADQIFELGNGPQHKKTLLTALALFKQQPTAKTLQGS